MHNTAMAHGELFFKTYLQESTGLKIVDIGAQDVNGSLRSVAHESNEYIGVDFCEANGVDVVLSDPYVLPFETATVDVVVSSSCYEHSEFFWLSFNEALRVLKPAGLLYINAPSNGTFHRHPVDCWRFYPDSAVALQNWGIRSGYNCALLESFIGEKAEQVWRDCVAVWVKDAAYAAEHPNRMLNKHENFMNGRILDSEEILNLVPDFNKDMENRNITVNQLMELMKNIKSQQPELANQIKLLLQ